MKQLGSVYTRAIAIARVYGRAWTSAWAGAWAGASDHSHCETAEL
jgi:hypothetical protein